MRRTEPRRPPPQPPRPPADRPDGERTDGLALPVTEELLQALAARVATILADSEPEARPEPWVGVAEAAAHLSCPRSRIYALTSSGRLPCRRDGTRLLFRLSEIDRWLERGGARRP
jgi:excisionase family DNA binding protein